MSLNSRDAAEMAAHAWNSTKADDDPAYDACNPEHKSRLLAILTSLESGVPSGVAGLDAYEVALAAALAEVTPVEEISPLLLGDGDEGAVDADALPDDFPGRAALAAAGINTYSEVESYDDLTAIPGIGAATAAKITEALEEN